ncbi:MAG: L,D-transpeptidase family protein [Rhodospirillales bacterium]|nr:L,D-transpeptidase family protein [Rhodospirillales bacterium]MCB9995484.1 L,D-transpeptidase family protein [Rhodospirillales bacterium]
MSQFIANSLKGKFLVLLSFLAMGLLGYTLTSNAQHQDGMAISNSPAMLLKAAFQSGLDAGDVKNGLAEIGFDSTAALDALYTSRNYHPIWVDGRDLSQAEEALGVFESSWTHGLNPQQYHVREIRSLIEQPVVDEKAKLELLLSDAAIRYGRDLSGMRFDPARINQKSEYWRTPLTAEQVAQKFEGRGNPVDTLKSLEPNTKLYRALQEELVRLTKEQNVYDHVLPMNFGGDHHFKPGERHKGVAALRTRLSVDGKEGADPSLYDDDTASAVMAFQRDHNLKIDGIIGPQTLALLNRGKKEQMEQIVANLERLRWLDQDRPDRYILVNIPQQLLWAIDGGKVAHEMKVVVGQPSRKTMEFKAEVTGVRFNPKWTVPLRLKMEDFLPKLREDPSYLAQKGIEVIKGYGDNAVTFDPEAIDWNTVTRRDMNEVRFVQSSGNHNALGRIRVLMPNVYNIYMHDTNHRELFGREQRALSSGCVRLSEPEKIADFILGHNENWSEERRSSLISAGRTVEVMADKPFPVYIIYQSIWQDDQGRLVFGPDVYKRDKALISVLANIDGYSLPETPKIRRADASGDEPGTALAYNQ